MKNENKLTTINNQVKSAIFKRIVKLPDSDRARVYEPAYNTLKHKFVTGQITLNELQNTQTQIEL